MSQQIDPNVVKYQAALKNDPLPPDLATLLTHKASVDQQLANTPSSHPTFAALQTKQATVAAAIAAHPNKNRATVND